MCYRQASLWDLVKLLVAKVFWVTSLDCYDCRPVSNLKKTIYFLLPTCKESNHSPLWERSEGEQTKWTRKQLMFSEPFLFHGVRMVIGKLKHDSIHSMKPMKKLFINADRINLLLLLISWCHMTFSFKKYKKKKTN